MTQLPAAPDPAPPEPAPSGDGVASVVRIDKRDDVAGVCGRIETAPTFAVVVHAPDGNRQLATQLGMRRLVRHAEDSGRIIAIATGSRGLAARARQAGVPVSRRPERVRWDAGGKRVLGVGPLSVAFPGLGRYGQFAFLSVVVLGVAAAGLTFGPAADVAVVPPMDERSATLIISGSLDVAEADFETLEMPAREVSASRTVTLAVQTTGTVLAPVGRALVLVTMANTGEADVTIPLGAVLRSVDGEIEFVIDQETVVPAGKSVTQQASATEIGPSGNVPAGTLTSWEEEAYLEVRVTHGEAAAGGTTEERPGVAAGDIAALEALAALLGGSEEWLRALATDQPGDAIFARTAEVEVIASDPSPPLGSPGPVVFLEVEVVITALAVAPATLETLFHQRFDEDAGRLVPGTMRAVETGRRQLNGEDGLFTSEFRLTALYSRVSTGDVKDAVKGKSPEDARSTLLERYGIQDADVDLVPGFVPWLPRFNSRIDVTFEQPEPEPADPSPATDAEPTATPTVTPTPAETPGA